MTRSAATVAAPLLVWAMIGDINEQRHTDPDHLLPPLTTTPAIRFALLGNSAIAVAVGLATPVLTTGGVGASIGGGLVTMAARCVVLMLGGVLVMLLVH